MQKKRMKYGYVLMLLLVASQLFGCETGGESRLKSVDVNVILEKSRPGKDAAAHLEKVLAVLQEGYDKLAARQAGLPAAKRQEELNRGLSLLQRQMAIETENARQIVLAALARVSRQWSSEHPTFWLVPRGNVLAAPEAADVTPDILQRMESEKVSFPDLPTVTIRNGLDAPRLTPPPHTPGMAREARPGAEKP